MVGLKAQQYTIRCPVSVRDDFDDYCNLVATADGRQRASDAFEAFHELFATEPGIRPAIRYETVSPTLSNSVDIELTVHGVRFFFEIDFAGRTILLNGISIK